MSLAFQAKFNKHSSLVRKSVNYGRKKFYKIGPSARCRPRSSALRSEIRALCLPEFRMTEKKYDFETLMDFYIGHHQHISFG